MLACHVAASQITRDYGMKVVLTRPIVAADEDMGYLPGDMTKKMEPWTKPMYDIFEKYFSYNQINRCISVEPLGYMRGRTFENTLIIADEMQNATANQVLMLLTRVGVNTKIILTGDLEQSDLGPENGLKELLYAMQLHDLRYIEHTELGKSDVVRHPAVKEVLKILKK